MEQAMFQFFEYSRDYIDDDYFAVINYIDKYNELRTVNVKNGCIKYLFCPL